MNEAIVDEFISGDPVDLKQAEKEPAKINMLMQTPEQYQEMIKKRLEEIEAKYQGELTPEQHREKKLAQIKISNELMGQMNELWKTLTRKQKRGAMAKGQKYSERLRKRLKK